jgi:hypothetical protein
MQLSIKNNTLQFIFLLFTSIFISCKKQDTLIPLLVSEVKLSYISFKQDTIPVKLLITTARKENVGSLFTTAVEGKLHDTILQKNNLIIRVTGDSARTYTNTEIFASYTDSLGITYANTIGDTFNKFKITKFEHKNGGFVEGSFTIRVRNNTTAKVVLLTEGIFFTTLLD